MGDKSTPQHAIEITFPVPVVLSREHEKRLVEVVSAICDDYEAAHHDRVMWPFGIGAKITYMPMTHEEEKERGMEFDDGVFSITVSERERYFPERYKPTRRKLIAWNVCPECGGELDTGWECNSCGFDAGPERRAVLAKVRASHA